MLITSLSEVTKEDIDKHRFEAYGSTLVRFCIDIQHNLIGFCVPKEDHVIGALTLLQTEEDIEPLDERQATGKFRDHIVGGTLYPGDGQAQIIASGTSIEQQLHLFKLSHSAETVQSAADKAVEIFKKFYPVLTYKLIKMPPAL